MSDDYRRLTVQLLTEAWTKFGPFTPKNRVQVRRYIARRIADAKAGKLTVTAAPFVPRGF